MLLPKQLKNFGHFELRKGIVKNSIFEAKMPLK